MKQPTESHPGHTTNGHKRHWLMLGAALLAGTLILAPYLLPAFGVGSGSLASEAIAALHGTDLGTGLVGLITSGLNAIPFIGKTLAAGGIANAAISGATGIGGILLGSFLEKKEDGKRGIKWGKVIKTAALMASTLIALPAILTGISVGIVYLSAAFGSVSMASSAVTLLSGTIGSMASMTSGGIGLSGAVAALPHLLTCGASLVPAIMSARLAGSKAKTRTGQAPDINEPVKIKPILAQQAPVVTATILLDQPLQLGMKATGKVVLLDSRGTRIMPEQLAITHTRKMHLFIADSSLTDYHHLHPVADGTPGEYRFSFTPKTANLYHIWTDITLLKDGSNLKFKTDEASLAGRQAPPQIQLNNAAEGEGMRFTWSSDRPLNNGRASLITVNVTDRAGRLVADLEPVMGAYGHLVGFSADGNSLIHTHPVQAETEPGRLGKAPLRFYVEPASEQPIQFFLHVRRQGKEMYVPFGQEVGKTLFASQVIAVDPRQANVSHHMAH